MTTIRPTVRAQVRAAIAEAWKAATAGGALPPMPADQTPPAIDIDRPARRSTATSRPTWLSSWRGRCAGPHSRSPRRSWRRSSPRTPTRPARSLRGGGGSRVHQPPPLRRGPRGDDRRHPPGPTTGGRSSAPPIPERQRRVRLGQPDRPADDRQRPRRLRRRPPVPRPRGRRPARHARVLLQRSRRPDRQPRGVGAGDPRGEPVPEDGYHGRTSSDLAAAVPDDVWAEATAPGADAAVVLGAGPAAGSAAGSRPASSGSASTSTSGRPRTRSTTTAGSSGGSSDYGSAATSTRRTARCGSAPPTSATTRTGS
jgi:hypothetical protein